MCMLILVGENNYVVAMCHPGFSLSLGSLHCISCPRWHVNLPITWYCSSSNSGRHHFGSVIVSTQLYNCYWNTNGIIFYANTVAANHSTFLSFSSPNFVTIFHSMVQFRFWVQYLHASLEKWIPFGSFWVELCTFSSILDLSCCGGNYHQ